MINQHSEVNVCAAFPIPAEEGDENDIVVYVVCSSNALNESDLKEWTRNEMPKFMWPKHIKIVEGLPRTPTNKIEKYKLKAEFQREINQTM